VHRVFGLVVRVIGIGIGIGVSGCGSPGANACEDVAAALGSAAGACGLDAELNRTAFIRAAAGGDCGTIQSVRDADALYKDCIPALEKLTCAQINDPGLAGQLPAGCVGQLLR